MSPRADELKRFVDGQAKAASRESGRVRVGETEGWGKDGSDCEAQISDQAYTCTLHASVRKAAGLSTYLKATIATIYLYSRHGYLVLFSVPVSEASCNSQTQSNDTIGTIQVGRGLDRVSSMSRSPGRSTGSCGASVFKSRIRVVKQMHMHSRAAPFCLSVSPF